MDTQLLSLNNIICIGNGGAEADELSRSIAAQHNLQYHGFLNNDTAHQHGCYHTSIYDIKPVELLTKIKTIDNLKIIMLDQDKSYYANDREFYDTIELGQSLTECASIEFVNPSMRNSFSQIVKTNKSFCILPFNTWRNRSHCCWQEPFSSQYTNFYDNPDSNKMRSQMLAGEPVELCSQCYAIESTGAISERQNQTIQWAHKLGLQSTEDVKVNLVNYEVSLGNKCNLMCRMCIPGNSNLISTEYSKLGLGVDIGVIPSDNFSIVDLNTVQRVQVAGGEPSITDDFYNFLKRCIEHNKTDLEIFVSTNCVAINKEFTGLVKQFSNIQFSISVDGFESINQYIRWPVSWTKLVSNIEKLTSVLSGHNYYFNTVVSIYNISRLYDLFNFLETTYPTSAYSISYLSEPAIMEPWQFPNKELALDNLYKIKTLKTYNQNEIFKSKIDGLINRIENSTVDLIRLKEFFEFNDKLDLSRGVKLSDYILELEHCRPG